MSRCSYLGLQDDPKTALEFASDGNFCHHALPAAPPNPAHQKRFCLSSEHTSCPVFLLTNQGPLPNDIILPGYRQRLNISLVYRGILLLILLAILVIALGAVSGLKGISPSPSLMPEETIVVPSIRPELVVVTGSSPLPTPPGLSVRPTKPLNSTISDCIPPDGWTLYTVIPTNSIFRLSLIFGISVIDLQSANCLGDDSILRPGDQIYLPPSQTSTPTLDELLPTPTRT